MESTLTEWNKCKDVLAHLQEEICAKSIFFLPISKGLSVPPLAHFFLLIYVPYGVLQQTQLGCLDPQYVVH